MRPEPLHQQQRMWCALLQNNRSQATALMSSLGGDVRGRVLAAVVVGVVQKQGRVLNLPSLQSAASLVRAASELNRLNHTSVTRNTQAVNALRSEAVFYDAAVRQALAPRVLMPQGVTQLPPPRPANFNFTAFSRAEVVAVYQQLETNSNPVSSPAYAAPADAVFATLFRCLDRLGTRTLTMAEMNAVVQNRETHDGDGDPLALVFNAKKGLLDVHELHKFFAGFKDYPSATGWSPGQGGEGSVVARYTVVNNKYQKGFLNPWGQARHIASFMASQQKQEATALLSGTVGLNLDAEKRLLVNGSSAQTLERIRHYESKGYLADPRAATSLAPVLKVLQTSDANSAVRLQATNALIDHLSRLTQLLSPVSISGVTAEVHVLQLLRRYLQDEKIDVKNPQHRIDAVALYQLYRQMLDAGELVSRQQVEGWVKKWKVPYEP